MSQAKRKRVIKPESILESMVKKGETFLIGVPFTEALVKRVDFKKFGLTDIFTEGEEQIPRGSSTRLKQNDNGLHVRIQPEEKVERSKHILFFRKRDNKKIEYDRIYNVFKKELVDKLKIGFRFTKNAQGEKFITSPPLTFDNSFKSNKVIAHVMNLFLELFGEYEPLRENLEYYIKYDNNFDEEILPKGELSNPRNFGELVEAIGRHVSEEEREPVIERLNVFKEFNPSIAEGAKGYRGYIIFVFEEKKLVAAESIQRDNATYFFPLKNYKDLIIKDKQEVRKEKLMLKKFYHTDNWEANIRKFLNKH